MALRRPSVSNNQDASLNAELSAERAKAKLEALQERDQDRPGFWRVAVWRVVWMTSPDYRLCLF